MKAKRISIILPCYNEAESLKPLLEKLVKLQPEAQIIVVDDGSTDATQTVCNQLNVNYINHLYNKGNGAAIKTGARAATGDILVFMDADGQHQVEDINTLLEIYNQGYDMVVGSRHKLQHANVIRYLGNKFYNFLASCIVGHKN